MSKESDFRLEFNDVARGCVGVARFIELVDVKDEEMLLVRRLDGTVTIILPKDIISDDAQLNGPE